MAKTKILILTDTMPWGHRSIAKAIFNYLKSKEKGENLEVVFSQVAIPLAINDIYTFIYRFFPATNKITLKLMENGVLRKTFLELSEYDLPEVTKQIKKIKPDLVISAYFLHSQSLAKWRKETGAKFKLWTVVADPWTANPISFIDGVDLHIVYDDMVEKMATVYGWKKETF